jgi:hypothetical protein
MAIALLAGCQPTRELAGVVTGVEAAGLQRVEAITVKADDGRERRFVISAEADRAGHAPSPSHLRQHMIQGDRIRVRYREAADGPLAIELVDLP